MREWKVEFLEFGKAELYAIHFISSNEARGKQEIMIIIKLYVCEGPVEQRNRRPI